MKQLTMWADEVPQDTTTAMVTWYTVVGPNHRVTTHCEQTARELAGNNTLDVSQWPRPEWYKLKPARCKRCTCANGKQ